MKIRDAILLLLYADNYKPITKFRLKWMLVMLQKMGVKLT